MDETEHQFDSRLCRVIAQAETTFHEDDYVWRPLADGTAPSKMALACVADKGAWFQFVPAADTDSSGRFRVVAFRFSETGPSAIGFVAWLHSHLRVMGRTGAIVICGKDRRESDQLFDLCQGVMDYWACPVGPAGDRFLKVIESLIHKGQGTATKGAN